MPYFMLNLLLLVDPDVEMLAANAATCKHSCVVQLVSTSQKSADPVSSIMFWKEITQSKHISTGFAWRLTYKGLRWTTDVYGGLFVGVNQQAELTAIHLLT